MTADSEGNGRPALRPPRQERSRASTEKVLTAVLELASTGSLEAVTVQAVAARAGVSVGAIYGRFGDKTTLVLAAQERFLQTVAQDVGGRVVRALSPEGTEQVDARQVDDARRVVGAVVAAVVETFARHEQLIRAFSTAARTTPALDERAEVVSQEIFAQVLAATTPHHDRIGHPDPATALDILFRLLFATLERRVQSATFISGRPLDWPRLATELGDLAAGYLRVH